MNESGTLHDLEGLSWPGARLAEAIEWLARRHGLSPRATEIPPAPPTSENSETLTSWIDAVASALGIEAEPVESFYPETDSLLKNCGPALLQVRVGPETRFLAVLRGGTRSLILVSPAL